MSAETTGSAERTKRFLVKRGAEKLGHFTKDEIVTRLEARKLRSTDVYYDEEAEEPNRTGHPLLKMHVPMRRRGHGVHFCPKCSTATGSGDMYCPECHYPLFVDEALKPKSNKQQIRDVVMYVGFALLFVIIVTLAMASLSKTKMGQGIQEYAVDDNIVR